MLARLKDEADTARPDLSCLPAAAGNDSVCHSEAYSDTLALTPPCQGDPHHVLPTIRPCYTPPLQDTPLSPRLSLAVRTTTHDTTSFTLRGSGHCLLASRTGTGQGDHLQVWAADGLEYSRLLSVLSLTPGQKGKVVPRTHGGKMGPPQPTRSKEK